MYRSHCWFVATFASFWDQSAHSVFGPSSTLGPPVAEVDEVAVQDFVSSNGLDDWVSEDPRLPPVRSRPVRGSRIAQSQ